MTVVIESVCHYYAASIALPVHEGDDRHEVEGESHERNSQLSQRVIEGGGQEDADQGANTYSNPQLCLAHS